MSKNKKEALLKGKVHRYEAANRKKFFCIIYCFNMHRKVCKLCKALFFGTT